MAVSILVRVPGRLTPDLQICTQVTSLDKFTEQAPVGSQSRHGMCTGAWQCPPHQAQILALSH